MAVDFPQFGLPTGLSGGSDTWDNGLAGELLSADYFGTAAPIAGSVSVALGGLTVSASGTVGIAAALGVALDDLTSASDATIQEPAPTRRGGDDAPLGRTPAQRAARKALYVRNRHYVIREPEPLTPGPCEQPRKVTAAIIEEAVAGVPEWFGTLAQARQAVPKTIPLLVPPRQQWTETDRAQLVAAARAYIEQAVRDYEAQQDEDDIELLLLAA